MKVRCDVAPVELEGDYVAVVEGVCATCSRCGHETESYGTTDASVRRCLALLHDECPNHEDNYYFDPDEPATCPGAPRGAYRRG